MSKICIGLGLEAVQETQSSLRVMEGVLKRTYWTAAVEQP